MEHLTDSEVQVVLSLKEGKGFDRISNPTSIVATLNGQSLETGCIEPDSRPEYATDLVWKADKNVLRRMRSGQEPLKIECFEMKNEQNRKDKIGHIILSLRSAKIVPPKHGDVGDVESPQWHKLSNLRNDVKAHKPEISLALTIEEHDAYVRRKSRQENHFSITPYLVEEESLIQLGPVESCHCLFFLNIIAIEARNLHLLKGETEMAPGNYSLWYRIMENDVQLKSFARLEKKWTLNEKIVIRIRSSPTVLRNYLQERPNFLLILQYKDTILGHSEIDLERLISGPEIIQDSSNIRENNEIVINQRCILNNENLESGKIDDDNADNVAFLDLQLQLINVGSQKLIDQRINDLAEIYEKPTSLQDNVYPLVDVERNHFGDIGNIIEGNNYRIQPTDLSSITENPRNVINQFPFSRSINTATDLSRVPIYSKSTNAYHRYCLNVNLMSIKFSLSSTIRNIEFRFHHPKAKETTRTFTSKMPLSSEQKLRLQDIGCKLYFITAIDEIRHLLLSLPPKVSVTGLADEAAHTPHSGETILDTGLLFNHDNKLESLYEAPLYNHEKREIGRIDVAMYLEDQGPICNENKSSIPGENLGPPIVDDNLAYKLVEELEIWKERQQEMFQVELKRKEERHLNRLSEEWQKHRENLESKLACSVQQCKMLADSLSKATQDLRTRRLTSLEKEARLIKANEDLQWRYEQNIQDLQEASRRMQEELSTKINFLQQELNNAEAQIEPLRVDNEKLWRLTNKQAEELQICQKGSLTQDQTASLLQDVKALEQKLLITQKSKAFFKEEWGKAVREIHRMKMENQQAIQVQIKTSKDELKNFDLEEILCADSSALTNDQIILGNIQREIEVIKPKSNRSFFPTSPIGSATVQNGHCCTTTAKSEEQDERLRKLIEERDALLKTGSYTIDDTIIVKLNAEIRSHLISSN